LGTLRTKLLVGLHSYDEACFKCFFERKYDLINLNILSILEGVRGYLWLIGLFIAIILVRLAIYRFVKISKSQPPNPQEHPPTADNSFTKQKNVDEVWLQEVRTIIEKKLPNTNFTVEELANDLHISRRHLNRRLKKYTDLSPAAYIKEMRLQRAQQLLRSRRYKTVSEVAYAVGFSKPSYFSQQFKKRFGKLPSAYL